MRLCSTVIEICIKRLFPQSRYQNFLKMHPDGRISRKSFHTMMKECYPGADTEKLERHIFRMYDSNKVNRGRTDWC